MSSPPTNNAHSEKENGFGENTAISVPSTSSDGHSNEDRHTDSTGSGEPMPIPGPLRAGKCKWFNVLKGIGFITPDDNTDDVFVHQSVLKMPGFRSLDEGECVDFCSKRTDRGCEATYVQGPKGVDLKGSRVHPLGKKRFQKIRCFNCGRYGNHVATKCPKGPMPKSCYLCQGGDHLIADCPKRPATKDTNGEEAAENHEEPPKEQAV